MHNQFRYLGNWVKIFFIQFDTKLMNQSHSFILGIFKSLSQIAKKKNAFSSSSATQDVKKTKSDSSVQFRSILRDITKLGSY